MRWQNQRQSGNVDDRRGRRVTGRGAAIGGGGILVLLLVAVLTGQDPRELLDMVGGSGSTVGGPIVDEPAGTPPQDDEESRFVSVILGSTEDVWGDLFTRMGRSYQPPRLVLFSGEVESACGYTTSAVGPFYCPADQQVYLDLSFFNELSRRFGAPGDFARAYVVAHEVGHHVQQQLGIADQVARLRQTVDREAANGLSVRMELQADCLAGVWGHHANRERNWMEPGDVEEGLGAAAAIGDDRIQRDTQGRVQPESWTHGSSDMRTRWLTRGLESGDPNACDPFGDEAL